MNNGYALDTSLIPSDKILNHPVVRELSKAVNVPEGFEFPYVLKEKVLMDEGVWNDHFYSEESIRKALNATDWSDRTNSNLFLEHSENAREWIGEVQNVHIKGKQLLGDLVIHDYNTAMKIQSGKPKFGISPKIKGRGNKVTGEITDFVFENFSVVLNPAVKTAYFFNSEEKVEDGIKLAQITDFEAVRKQKGMSVSEFYAIPRDPPSASKLPIFDAAHVRNALARINQVKGVSSSEIATAKKKIAAAAKKFGIKTQKMSDNADQVLSKDVDEKDSGGHKMAEEEKKPEPEGEEEKAPEETPKGEGEEVKKEEESKEEDKEEPKEEENEPADEAKDKELSEVESKISALEAVLGELKKKQDSLKPKSVTSELSDKLLTLEKKLDSIQKLSEARLLEPDKRGVNAPSASKIKDEVSAKLSEIKKDPNAAMMKFLMDFKSKGGL